MPLHLLNSDQCAEGSPKRTLWKVLCVPGKTTPETMYILKRPYIYTGDQRSSRSEGKRILGRTVVRFKEVKKLVYYGMTSYYLIKTEVERYQYYYNLLTSYTLLWST